MDNPYPVIRLLPRMGRRAQAGHPWAYSNEIVMDQTAKAHVPGSMVRVASDAGEMLGVAMFNPHSLIAARFLSRDANTRVDGAFLADRVSTALALREAFYADPYYRLIHAEADGLPGLVVDRLGEILVVQPNCAGMDLLAGDLVGVLQDLLAPRALIVRGDSPVRELEGLDERVETFGQMPDKPIEVIENRVTYLADPVAGQKTGWFFDQRDNRHFMAQLSGGLNVLDVYAHTGGFGLAAAAANAQSVTMVDRAEPALNLARQAAEHAGHAEQCQFVQAEAFGDLTVRRDRGEFYDMVICDPPAFVRSKKDIKSGTKGYRKLTRLAARLVSSQGWLAIASCSYHVTADLLLDQINLGLRDAGRIGRIVRQSGAGSDHPIHPGLPESAYLKFVCLRLD